MRERAEASCRRTSRLGGRELLHHRVLAPGLDRPDPRSLLRRRLGLAAAVTDRGWRAVATLRVAVRVAIGVAAPGVVHTLAGERLAGVRLERWEDEALVLRAAIRGGWRQHAGVGRVAVWKVHRPGLGTHRGWFSQNGFSVFSTVLRDLEQQHRQLKFEVRVGPTKEMTCR